MHQRYCPECTKPLTWIPQYQRWYCKKEKMYPELPLCPLCQQPLYWIPQYKRWYCHDDTTYPSLELAGPPTPPPEEQPIAPPKSPYELKIEKADEMREHPEPAEQQIWEILNSSVTPKFPEHTFCSQSLQYGYILDFYCPTLKLAIEVDGGIHNNRRVKDSEKDFHLAKQGIHVFRVSNEEVFNNSEGLTDSLCKIIQEITEQEYKRKLRHDRTKRYRRQY